jgi:hypothetical protein
MNTGRRLDHGLTTQGGTTTEGNNERNVIDRRNVKRKNAPRLRLFITL